MVPSEHIYRLSVADSLFIQAADGISAYAEELLQKSLDLPFWFVYHKSSYSL